MFCKKKVGGIGARTCTLEEARAHFRGTCTLPEARVHSRRHVLVIVLGTQRCFTTHLPFCHQSSQDVFGVCIVGTEHGAC